jgi:carbonic anhydrase
VSEDILTGSRPGTIFVHRNIANMVSFNNVGIATFLEYALVHPKFKDVIVCGHTRCGGIAALENGVKENYIADWLCVDPEAKTAADELLRNSGFPPMRS